MTSGSESYPTTALFRSCRFHSIPLFPLPGGSTAARDLFAKGSRHDWENRYRPDQGPAARAVRQS
jgi:hypothetical protein